MQLNIDSGIFFVFLLINLAVGLFYSRGIKNIREYAVGARNFSTPTIASTIVATWIAGSSLTVKVSETYSNGLYFIFANLADPLSFVIIGYLLAPRMKEFLGKLSVAEFMGSLYGPKVRLFAAIAAAALCIGYVGIQVKMMSVLLSHFFHMNSFFALWLTIGCVILYSAFGGIKAVTFTDILQFFTFGVFIPGLSIIILGTLSDPQMVTNMLSTNKLFDWEAVFSLQNPEFLPWLFLFLYGFIPDLDPAIFQRISIAKNTKQVRSSFLLASVLVFFLCIFMYFIGILLLSTNPNADPSALVSYVIDNYSYTGLKSLTIIGIIAMAMSTVDSYINTASILLSYDVPASLNIKLSNERQLMLSRILAILVGTLSIIPALLSKRLLTAIIHVSSVYMPVVTVPLLLSLFGFRSSPRVVLTSMFIGSFTVIFCNMMDFDFNSVIPAMCANMFSIFFLHYTFKQPGGWVGIADDSDLRASRIARIKTMRKFYHSIKSFSLRNFVTNNAPKSESVYSLFAIFGLISVFSSFYSLPAEMKYQYKHFLEFIFHSVLIVTTIFLTYIVWPQTLKNQGFIQFAWNLSLPYILVFVPTLLIIISNFGQFQLMILVVNLVILSSLLRWHVALVNIIVTVGLAIYVYEKLLIPNFGSIHSISLSLQFKIMYVLILVSSVLVIFFKPQQEYIKKTEHKVKALKGEKISLVNQVHNLNERVDHYNQVVEDQNKEIGRLSIATQKILNNVNHELRLPIGNVINFADMLYDALAKSDNNLVKELAKEVYDNSNRVSSMILNMLDLVTLDVNKIDLDKKLINFSEMIEDRVRQCQKIYVNNKKLSFSLDLVPELMISVDPNYIRQTIDNLVTNSINFSNYGNITIKLTKEDGYLRFVIQDEGVGVPPQELHDIFTPFKLSSITESKAHGRGVGLALCKAAIEAHGGEIHAYSDGKKGAKFEFILQMN
jgi:Na+/proline symporter/signal transduction histidine kinase